LAALHERETRVAARCLGLPSGRLLMTGLFDGTIPDSGPVFDAVVRAVVLVMWARDCNVICAPWAGAGPVERATDRIAEAVAARSGVAQLAYAAAGSGVLTLDISRDLPAKQQAIAAHRSHPQARGAVATAWETYLRASAAA
jgi:LmbE family N-acetylglucosaminyl deacetylase